MSKGLRTHVHGSASSSLQIKINIQTTTQNLHQHFRNHVFCFSPSIVFPSVLARIEHLAFSQRSRFQATVRVNRSSCPITKTLTMKYRKAYCSYTAPYPLPTTLPPLPSSIPRKSNKLLHPHLNTYSTKSRKGSHKYHRKQLHKNHHIPPRNPRQTQPTSRSSK